MAKLVQLKQNGVEVFPRTVSNAIAVEAKNRLLSTVLTDVETEALGWSIEETTPGSTLSYTLYKTTSENGVTGKTSVSTFTVAQDIYLDQVYYVADSEQVPPGHEAPGTDFPYLLMVFNTASNKQDLWISVKDLVDIYTADGSGITETNGVFSIELDSATGNILTKSANGLLVTIAAEGDNYVSATIDDTAKNKVVVESHLGEMTYTAAEGQTPANLTGTSGITDAQQAATAIKSYVDAKVADLSISATGDTYVNAVVDANNNKKINVSTNTASVTFDGTTSALTIGDTAGLVTNEGATAIKNYIDAKTEAEIEKLDANVDSTGGSYIGVNVVEVNGKVSAVTVTEEIQAVASADTNNKGLAEASDVKAYVDGKVEALDSNKSDTEMGITVAVDQENGVVTGVTLTIDAVTDSAMTGTLTDKLVEAKAIKDYVDAKSAGVTILDTKDIDADQTSAGTSLVINFANSGSTDATEGAGNKVFNPNQELAINGKQVYTWGVTAEDKGDITITWPGEQTQNNEPEQEP